jgi:hypothetical protein
MGWQRAGRSLHETDEARAQNSSLIITWRFSRRTKLW